MRNATIVGWTYDVVHDTGRRQGIEDRVLYCALRTSMLQR